ncbi:DUF4157 domain-containing protein [Flavobacterium sp. LC2016-23]|uniref:eCIS core domain-containing protein n=1 Tax=Flavobacterium sp. LC2016-23 TaxID=2666330 RepID=UPI0012B0A712|nr:DUF4157 domain-containing protein [Flavobacterium sp. LC2016-23]MRX41871.1 DUF4157 domain-containing protein [Flavobacterium sp. LC2016-23]
MKYAKHKTETKQLTSSAGNLKGNKAIELEDNRSATVQRKSNNTGLPDALKNGMESLSNKNLDHVKVHYNSSKPAAVQALAYAQGSNIHLAPGQEKHLPHELGHVVQQMEGRVKPTIKIGGTAVNNDPSLEQEATSMGQRAIQRASISRPAESAKTIQPKKVQEEHTAQFQSMDPLGVPGVNYAVMSQADYGKWQGTVQAKSMSGVHQNGDQVVVTQFQNSSEVQQYFLSNRVVGGFVILEGILSLSAGIAILALSHGVALVPGIAAIAVGVAKIVRGAITIHGNDNPSKTQKGLIDSLRAFEAIAAVVGASGGSVLNIAGLVFGLAKALRSVMHFLMDFVNKENYPNAHKAFTGMAAALHWIEVGAGLAAGSTDAHSALAGEGAQKAVTAVSGLGVAASKTLRSANQSVKAVKTIRSSPEGLPTVNTPLIA